MVEPAQADATPGDIGEKTLLDAPLSDFLDSKAKTIDEDGTRSGTYVRDLARVVPKWIDWMQRRGDDTLEGLDGRAMARWAEHLDRRVKNTADEGISAATAWSYYDLVSAYLTYCSEWEYIAENPARTAVAKTAMPDRRATSSADQQFWSPEQRQTLIRHVDERAHDAIDERGSDALAEVRDRALVYLLGYSGVRGAEILRPAADADTRRTGIDWRDLDLGEQTVDVLGKSQAREQAPLTDRPIAALERWETVLDPPSDDWPVFPTLHLPSLRDAAREQLEARDAGEETIADVTALSTRPLLEAMRERELAPPAMTTEGARYLLRKLTDEADVDVGGDGKEYLTLHGARRGAGEQYYREAGPSAAQRALRHADPSTTSEMYSHIEASELSEIGSEAFEEE